MTPARPRVLFGARARILTAFVVLLAGSTVVSTIALRQILLVRADERVDRNLAQEVEEFRRLVTDGRDPRDGRPFAGDVRALFDVYLARNVPGQDEDLYTFLDDRPYRSSATGEPDPAVVRGLVRAAGADGERGTIETADGPVRYLATPVRVQGRRRGTFVVTETLGPQRADVDEAVRVAAGVSLAVLLLASALAWLVAGRVLAPLRTLRDTARSIGDDDLTRRIEVSGHDEIAELGRTFNAMLDRLERTFDAQRALVSDAGHELRTPITIIRGHLELLGDDPDERRETVALVTDELDRMARFVDDLLTLARAEQGGDFLHRGDVDLDVLTEELLAKAQALAPDREWRIDRVAVGRLHADRQRLTQAVANLARNAVEHTDAGDEIALGSAFADGEARIWVRDRGPGVAAEEQARIFERFARAGRSKRRSDGAGLGLSITRAIAEAHGGRVELDSRAGAGATFTVVVPVEEEDPLP